MFFTHKSVSLWSVTLASSSLSVVLFDSTRQGPYAHGASWSQLVDPILLSLDHFNQISGIRKLAINHKGRSVHSEGRIKGRGIGRNVGRTSLGMIGLGDGVRRASLGRSSIVLSPRAR